MLSSHQLTIGKVYCAKLIYENYKNRKRKQEELECLKGRKKVIKGWKRIICVWLAILILTNSKACFHSFVIISV